MPPFVSRSGSGEAAPERPRKTLGSAGHRLGRAFASARCAGTRHVGRLEKRRARQPRACIVFTRIYCAAGRMAARGFLLSLLRSVPYRVQTVLTGNGTWFVDDYEAGRMNT